MVAGLVLLAVILLGGWFVLFASYSDGYRVGRVIKLSQKGYIFKTWEGTLDFGYLQADPTQQGISTRTWDFSVPPGEQAARAEIDKALAGNEKVKIYYREKYVRLFFMGDTPHFVYKVERLGPGDQAAPQAPQAAPQAPQTAPPTQPMQPASPLPAPPAAKPAS
jgi:hypothetical protein